MRDRDCIRCGLHAKSRTVCLWGEGKRGTLMLVSSHATYDDTFNCHHIWGEAGDLLDHILFKLGLGREDLYITGLLKCSPGKAGLPRGKAIDSNVEACLPYLMEEIRAVDPKVIVPMGSLATKHLAKANFISRVDGSPFKVEGWLGNRWIVPCHHPSAALQAPGLEKNIAMALDRALYMAGLHFEKRGQGLIYNHKDTEEL